MRMLYIAPVRDFSGYANAARGYIRALAQAGADLVVRPVRYDRADDGKEYQPTDLERELLTKPLDDIDVVIQHTTPNEMRPVPGKVNIAITAWETTRIPGYWAKKLNQFDAVITFCDESIMAFRNSGVTVPIWKVPHTFDMQSYNLDDVKELETLNADSPFKDKFVFYNISQLSAKKGIDVLLRSYYAQFWDKKDDVILVLKSYINMSNRQQEQEQLAGYIQSVKQGMRLPDYPPVLLLTQTMTDEQIKKLHRQGDAYVCSSRAEGWCIPAFEALAYGNKLISTNWGGMGEFHNAGDKNFYPVQYSLEPLVGQQHADPELYTSLEKVAEPSVSSMMDAMQAAYDDRDTILPRHESLDDFDYSAVGQEMLKVITQAVEGASNEQPV